MRHEAAANFVKYALSTFIIERTWRRRRFWPSARPKVFIAQNERLIILGCFWSDQPLGCSVFLRHVATVTTVPLEEWRRASTSTVKDVRRLAGRPRALPDKLGHPFPRRQWLPTRCKCAAIAASRVAS